MASASPSSFADAKKDKPSFAKIAAAGIKPPNVQQRSPTSSNTKHDVPSPPLDGAPLVAPPDGSEQTNGGPKHNRVVQVASNDVKQMKEPVEIGNNGPEVRVQIVESVPRQPKEPAPEGSLVPSSDDVGTQISSSSGSNKPQSLDGKSDVASGTTFALDEKDSLRPDDSASVKAVEEDDLFPPGSGLPGSRIGSDDGVRAFRDQLREISSMDPRGRGPPQIYGHAPKGVLYVPPQGPGIGSVPASRPEPPVPEPTVDCAPDQKLLEALENPRDRVWVLKLEQDVIDFVKDPKESSLTLPQCHSFYRLLAHKMADYYMLGHLVDDTSAAVRLYKTPDCRIPPPLTGITQPSTAASTPPPSAHPMKILKRGVDRSGPAIANGSNMPSKSGSENGDSGDDKKKAPVTREEREARYEAARLRIMGSAKPTESPEAAKDKLESRPNSTTGKKSKKKARADSDDGFDPRSAYSNYYTPPYGSDGVVTPSYGYQAHADGATHAFPSAYVQQSAAPNVPQMPMQQSSTPANWNMQGYQQVDPTQAWAQGQSSGYDLSADFQRSMTLQQNQMPAQSPTGGFNAGYGNQYNYGAQQQAWPQQQQQPQYQMQPQMSQTSYGYQATGQMQSDQSYAFGQLPSQAFPGRPPSKTEHPLPGSYKSKHFNPQSQAFIPGQANGSPFSPHAASVAHSIPQGYGPGPTQTPQRQNSAQSHSSAFGSPHLHNSPNMIQGRTHGTPLTHPLPQGPVFPRQNSPNVPLPAKPGSTPQQQHRGHEFTPIPPPAMIMPSIQQQQHQQHQPSLLAKWGAPASLPAKPPPPSAESFDAVKLKQMQQQQPFVNSPSNAAAARHPPGLPMFGTMPQNGAAQIVNGSAQYTKRT